MTQNNLGNALQSLGQREGGTERLNESVAAYRAALQEHTRDRVPSLWATIQNKLGSALQALGERESSTERLNEAVEAYRAALLERTRERVPLEWAMTHSNIGNALLALGERENSVARLSQAMTAYRAALAVFEETEATYYLEGARRNLTRAEALLTTLRPEDPPPTTP